MCIVVMCMVVMGMVRFGVILLTLLVTMAFLMITVTVFIAMGMRFERTALPHVEQLDALAFRERHQPGLASQCFKRFCQKDLQIGADPEHDIGSRQHARLGGTHGIGVRRAGALQDELRLADTFHHPGHQRVNRLDGSHNFLIGCERARDPSRCQQRQGGCGGE